MGRSKDLDTIERGIEAAARVLEKYTPGAVEAKRKGGGDPVTAADLELDAALRSILPGPGDGILTEETTDDLSRLSASRVWIVDPLDGTKEFVSGIPEWCVSIGLVEDGVPVAGGILNPAAGHRIVGSDRSGVTLNGEPARVRATTSLGGATVLASRSEVRRGEWTRFENRGFEVVPMGSVAYKLGLVAAGLTDATWTLVPKNEWDVAAGAALVLAGGGDVRTLSWSVPRLNRENTLMDGLIAFAPGCGEEIRSLL
jgi:myo-inositol-1(or 4)-monophosphatase